MSDFRIQLGYLQISGELVEREFDWTNNKWTLSERPSGLGQSWDSGIEATQEDLYSLLDFFRVPRGAVAPETISTLSPGELALLHTQLNPVASIYADLCHDCGKHWTVYKKDLDTSQWMKYGRNCDFTWFRGTPLEPEDVARLQTIQK